MIRDDRRFLYECVNCSRKCFGTLEEIRTQLDCSVDEPISPGLTYKPEKIGVYEIVTDNWRIDQSLYRDEKNHGLTVLVLKYLVDERSFASIPSFKSSKVIRGNLRSGRTRILTYEEFLKLEEDFERLRRQGISPELERIIRGLTLKRTYEEIERLTKRS